MYSFTRFITKDLVIKSEEERTIQGIVTAEIVDKQGEITIRDALLKAIKKYMKNTNRSMSDTHTNRTVGQWNKAYPVEIVDLDDNKIAGIVVEGHIFKGTKMYDDIWNKIKAGIYRGLSFGGATNSDRVPVPQKDGKIAYQLKDLDVYEIAICQEPAVPWAIVTSFNQLAKAYTSKEIQDMKVFEKDDQVVIQCDNHVCYVNQTTDTIVDYGDVETVMLNSSPKRNLSKDMSKEETKNDEKDEKDEDDTKKMEHNDKDEKDEKDEEKSLRSKQDDKKDEDTKDEKDEEKSDIESLKDIVGDLAKTVHLSIKQDHKWKKDLRTEIDGMKKALETPAPAEEHSGGDEVKLGNEYNDDPKAGARASEDPKEADSEGEDDKINMEEKSERVEKSQKDVKKTPYPSTGQDIDLGDLLKNTSGSEVLKAARETGDLGKVALMIKNGDFGRVRQMPIGYPQVMI